MLLDIKNKSKKTIEKIEKYENSKKSWKYKLQKIKLGHKK